MTIADRLESRSIRIPECGCRLWLGAVTSEGYGHLKVITPTRVAMVGTHRAAWECAYGPIPDGLHVLHRCDVRLCIEPTHLFLGTNFDNVADRVAKGRGHDVAGERNPFAKFTDAQIAAMRADARKTSVIADEFGTSSAYVRQIKRAERRAA